MVTRPDGLVTIIAFLLVYLKCLLLRLSLGAIMSYFVCIKVLTVYEGALQHHGGRNLHPRYVGENLKKKFPVSFIC